MTTVLGVELPAGWVQRPMKAVTVFLNRGTAPDYSEGGAVWVLGQSVVKGAQLQWGRVRKHEHVGDPRNLRGYLVRDDVLINSTGTGTLGRIGFFPGGPEGVPCMADGHLTIARADPALLSSRFLYYWLGSSPFQELVRSGLVVGATNQIELSRDRLAAAPVPVPPMRTQRQIASFLDSMTSLLDELVGQRRTQLHLLEERLRSGVDDVFDHRGFGRTRLKYLLRFKPRYGVLVPEFVDEGVPLIRIGDLLDLPERMTDMLRIPETLSRQYPTTVVRRQDVLVSVVGTLGRSVVATDAAVGANVNRAIAVLRVRSDVDPHLVSAWMGSSMFVAQAQLATGSDSAQPTLGMEDLAGFTLRWPTSRTEQGPACRDIRALATWSNAMRQTIISQMEKLAERRQALITAAVTGQIDVSTASGVTV